TINEGDSLNLTLSASDSDIPANALSYSLVSGPSGSSVSSAGQVSWTASELEGGTAVSFTVKVTDNGAPPLSDTKSFTVMVNEVNTAPVLAPISDKTIRALNTLSFVLGATDSDLPANHLTYGLVSGPPGSSLDSSTGTFTWTPTLAQAASTN